MSRSAGGRRMWAAAQCTPGGPPPSPPWTAIGSSLGGRARPPWRRHRTAGESASRTRLQSSPPDDGSVGLPSSCSLLLRPLVLHTLLHRAKHSNCCPLAVSKWSPCLYALAHPSCSKSVLYAVLLLVCLHLLNSVPILGCILQKRNLIYSHLIVVVQSCVFIESFHACVLTCLCIGHCLAVPERVNLPRVKPEL